MMAVSHHQSPRNSYQLSAVSYQLAGGRLSAATVLFHREYMNECKLSAISRQLSAGKCPPSAGVYSVSWGAYVHIHERKAGAVYQAGAVSGDRPGCCGAGGGGNLLHEQGRAPGAGGLDSEGADAADR